MAEAMWREIASRAEARGLSRRYEQVAWSTPQND
jgi:hypothetical protein